MGEMRYRIRELSPVWEVSFWTVEAGSPEEAIEMTQNGEAEWLDSSVKDGIDGMDSVYEVQSEPCDLTREVSP